MLTIYTVAFAFCGPDVLLIRKCKPAWQKGLLNGIGGKVELGETNKGACIREFREETGLLDMDLKTPLLYHCAFWQHLQGDALVYFYTFDIPKAAMVEAIGNTIDSPEPCVVVKTEKVINGTIHGLIYNIPYLVSMANTYRHCTTDQLLDRLPTILGPYSYQRIPPPGPVN
jgi:ADP-ribose pyrophosphatase YjhB (NUDIX family)